MIWLISASVGCCSLILLRYFLRKRVSISGKTVLITGASSGLGEALARLLFEEKCSLILLARRLDRLEALRDDLMKKHPNFVEPRLIKLDLSKREEIFGSVELRNLVETVPIDCLINNAGLSQRSSTLGTSNELADEIFRVNFFSLVDLTKIVLEKIIERKRRNCSIVNISSLQGLIAVPDRSFYSASKHAVQAFSDSLRMEIQEANPELNLNISVISPGYIRTELDQRAMQRIENSSQKLNSNRDSSSSYQPEYVARKILQAIEFRQNEMIVAPIFHRFAVWLRRIFPTIYFFFMVLRNKKLKAEK